MTYDGIQDQKEKVLKLEKAFDDEKEPEKKLRLLYIWLDESNKLDKMEDIYLRADVTALSRIAEAVI
jgi:hypothetical protein